MRRPLLLQLAVMAIAGQAAAQTGVQREDTPHVSGQYGNACWAVRQDAAAALAAAGDYIPFIVDGSGRLWTSAVQSGTWTVTGAGGTFPVTGTFWQVTQPVSGPLTDVQLRATPVPVSGTVTVTDGAGALNVIIDSSAAIAVTGPLTDVQLRATPVPVSGTVAIANLDVALSTRLKPADTLAGLTTLGTITNVVHVDDNASTLTVDAPVGTPLFARLSDGAAALIGSKVSASSLPVVIASDQGAVATSISGANFPDNEPFNVAQWGGAATSLGSKVSASSVPVVIASDQGAVTVAQATAANLNVRSDASGAIAAAVPARAEYLGLNDGTNTVGSKAASAANLATALVSGVQMNVPAATWCVQHTPAAATKATISQAAGAAGVRHYGLFYSACFAAGATAGPVQTFAIRDGATGAGTVKWSGALAAPVNGSMCNSGPIGILGTAATAMTIEFGAAGAATTIETVSLCGMDVN